MNISAHHQDQRMIHVNLDKSAEVAELAELRHRELMPEKDVKEQLELQEQRAASWAANEQAKMNAREADVKNAAYESQLNNHNLSELQQQAHNRETLLREELRTQTELIRELRETPENSARGNFEANLRTSLTGPMGSNELPLGQPFRSMQRSVTDSSGDPHREVVAGGGTNIPKVDAGGPPGPPSSSDSSSSDDKKKSKKDKKRKKKDDKEQKRGRSPHKKHKNKQKGVSFSVRVTFIVELIF